MSPLLQSPVEIRRHPRAVIAARVLGFLAFGALMLLTRTFWQPDTLFVVLVIGGAVFGLTRQMLVRFAPFLGLLVVFDWMRGWADRINTTVHFLPQLNVDKWLFRGTVPTIWLQDHLWRGHVSWWDIYFVSLYMMHFLLPVIVALVLWRWRPRYFWAFEGAIVTTSLAAVLTYAVYPAAPPWMAVQEGLITGPYTRIMGNVASAIGLQNFSAVDSMVSPNDVAAVPSLHAAYPLIACIFLIAAFGWKRAGWTVLYPLSLWVGVVYLGEHYVFDVLLGIGYAAAFCWLMLQAMHRVQRGRDERLAVLQQSGRPDDRQLVGAAAR